MGKREYTSLSTDFRCELRMLQHFTAFHEKMHQQNLVKKFSLLRGVDLIYACIAFLEDIPLVTYDTDFDVYKDDLNIINPTRDT